VNKDQIAERGAPIARRDGREYLEYSREKPGWFLEPRNQPAAGDWDNSTDINDAGVRPAFRGGG
jgi:hypothetical protein